MLDPNWIELGAAVGTVLAAIISAFALLELQKARKQSIRPFINIDSIESNIESSHYSSDFFSKKFESNNDYILPGTPSREFEINISNIGNGTAINIQLEIDIDIDKLINQINSLNLIVYLQETKSSIQHLVFLSDKDKNSPIFSTGYKSFFPKWYLSAIKKDATLKMIGPKMSLNLLAYILVFCRQLYQDRKYPYTIPDFLENYFFDCKICYSDIEGKYYLEKFKGRFRFLGEDVLYTGKSENGIRIIYSRSYRYIITFTKVG